MDMNSFISGYRNFVAGFPEQIQIFINLLVLTIIVCIYAVFVWKFDWFISTKDILRLNLNKYNKTIHPTLTKLVAGGLYFLEYIIILPLLIFFSFAIFVILLMLISNQLETEKIILIAAITVASIRMLSYIPKYGESVSGQVAKIIPFTILVFSLTEPYFLNFEKTMGQPAKLPEVINLIWVYFFFIVALELVLRFFDFSCGVFNEKKED